MHLEAQSPRLPINDVATEQTGTGTSTRTGSEMSPGFPSTLLPPWKRWSGGQGGDLKGTHSFLIGGAAPSLQLRTEDLWVALLYVTLASAPSCKVEVTMTSPGGPLPRRDGGVEGWAQGPAGGARAARPLDASLAQQGVGALRAKMHQLLVPPGRHLASPPGLSLHLLFEGCDPAETGQPASEQQAEPPSRRFMPVILVTIPAFDPLGQEPPGRFSGTNT